MGLGAKGCGHTFSNYSSSAMFHLSDHKCWLDFNLSLKGVLGVPCMDKQRGTGHFQLKMCNKCICGNYHCADLTGV